MKSHAKFSGRNQLATCRCCNKLTHSNIDGSNTGLCRVCYDSSGLENEHSDYGHETPHAECPTCLGVNCLHDTLTKSTEPKSTKSTKETTMAAKKNQTAPKSESTKAAKAEETKKAAPAAKAETKAPAKKGAKAEAKAPAKAEAKKEAAKKGAAKAEAKEARERHVISGEAKITVLVKDNPFRGDLSGRTFGLFKTGQTVAQWREACAKAKADPGYLHPCLRRGYIKVTEA